MKQFKNIMLTALTGIATTLSTVGVGTTTSSTPEPIHKKMCVFDIIGTQGDVYSNIKDYKIAALNWGVDFELKVYTEEKIAADDFKAGRCDAVVLSGLRGRGFNPFTGSLDSPGSIPTKQHMKSLLQLLAKPRAAKYMKNGEYEVAGIVPAGEVYIFVNDRALDTPSELSGKKVAILEYDRAQVEMANVMGASMVGASISNFASKFNNGSVDVCAAPALAFSALELYKGLDRANGGVLDFVLGQVTLQLILRHEGFPADFGQKSREHLLSFIERSNKISDKAKADIDDKYWVKIPKENRENYNEMMRQARITLRDKGIYDAQALTIFRKVRCKIDPAASECSAPDKE